MAHIPLLHVRLRSQVSRIVSASDASRNDGGLVFLGISQKQGLGLWDCLLHVTFDDAVDSQVVLGVLVKGRNSSVMLGKINSTILSGNLLPSYVFIRTDLNPADAPLSFAIVQVTLNEPWKLYGTWRTQVTTRALPLRP
eukprot:1350179-Amphidinium_carterae.1